MPKQKPLDNRLCFVAVIAGGIGPGVWDTELCVVADDIQTALKECIDGATEAGGTVISIEQAEYHTMDNEDLDPKEISAALASLTQRLHALTLRVEELEKDIKRHSCSIREAFNQINDLESR